MRALTFHQCGLALMSKCGWVEFVGSLLCSERFFSGYLGCSLSPKTFKDLSWLDKPSDLNKIVIVIIIIIIINMLWCCHLAGYAVQ